MNTEYHLKELMQVNGDWFCVSFLYESGKTRVFIERVVMWALVQEPKTVERIIGLDSSGMPFSLRHSENESHDIYYVFGSDLSPAARSWSTIYHSITPHKGLVWEVEDPEILKFFNGEPGSKRKQTRKQSGDLN